MRDIKNQAELAEEIIEKANKEGKIICILHHKQPKNEGYIKVWGIYETDRLVNKMVSTELRKIPKWIRKLFKIKIK